MIFEDSQESQASEIPEPVAYSPTPVWLPLYLYCKAERECYINHMEGFKALVSWLIKDSFICYDLEKPGEPVEIPPLFYGYTFQEVSKHLIIPVDNLYIEMLENVIPRLELAKRLQKEKAQGRKQEIKDIEGEVIQ